MLLIDTIQNPIGVSVGFMFVQTLILFVFVFTNFCALLKTQDKNPKAEVVVGFLQAQDCFQTVSIFTAQQDKPQTPCHRMWFSTRG